MNTHYRDFLIELESAGVEYAVVGAFALALHGFPRTTGDIDILFRRERENVLRLHRALRALGTPISDTESFLEPDTFRIIGVAPHRINLLGSINGVEFDEVWQGRVVLKYHGVLASVIGRRELLRSKLAAGRHKDLADAEVISKMIEESVEEK